MFPQSSGYGGVGVTVGSSCVWVCVGVGPGKSGITDAQGGK
jgi:hypothetical protein